MKTKKITRWPPLFITRLQGYFDARRGAVKQDQDQCRASYIEKKYSIGRLAIQHIYVNLEEYVEKLEEESIELSIEYKKICKELQKPDELLTGCTCSLRARQAAQIALLKPNLEQQRYNVIKRLSLINEVISAQVNQTKVREQEIRAMTERRIHEYLHGVSLATKKVPIYVNKEWKSNCEDEFKLRHLQNEKIRKNILEKWLPLLGGENDIPEKEK